MEELDEKLIGKAQRIFKSSEGQDVLKEFRIASAIDEPFGDSATDAELRYRTGWHDAFRWINAMVEYQGEE